jgi:hypothetical protein
VEPLTKRGQITLKAILRSELPVDEDATGAVGGTPPPASFYFLLFCQWSVPNLGLLEIPLR